jgi:hypothetical protein
MAAKKRVATKRIASAKTKLSGKQPSLETRNKALARCSWTRSHAPMSSVLTVFPEGLRFTIHARTAERDRVAIVAESYGKHVSGKIYNNTYHFVLSARGGKIVEWREYMDTMDANDVLCGAARRNEAGSGALISAQRRL